MPTDPPGLPLSRLRGFLDDAAPGLLDGSLAATVVAGGKSNLTYRVTDGSKAVIVRRPPLGHVLATAHDMGREHRVITALAPTAVPVPDTFALCTDPAVIGAPFYVMEEVAGTVYRSAAELAPLGPARTARIAAAMVDTLVGLHAVDPAAVGLGDFGHPEGFLARQVARWGTQLAGSHSRDLPHADALYERLQEAVPDASAATIVHGDFRLDNLLIDDGVSAVLDWEMATLGDPLTDVALLYVYHQLPALEVDYPVSDVSVAPGFPSGTALLERYVTGSGRGTSHLPFHLGLAYFKLAVILEGIHYRYLHQQTVGEGFDRVGDAVAPLLEAGLDAIKGGD